MLQPNKISYRLKTLRKQKGLTQSELSSLLDVSRSNVTKMETSQQLPTLEQLVKLSKLYECTIDYIIKG